MDRNNSNDRTTTGAIAATVIIATVAMLALAGLTGSICAAGGENAGGSEGEVTGAAVSTAGVTNSISYQGRLTNSSTGEPLFGPYYITFRLYNASTEDTALDMDAHDVEIVDGLFNTHIDFDQSHFDGSALWLGVQVEADPEMTPRQELRPVPYALSLVPGAVINSSGPTALTAYSGPSIGLLGISGSSYSPPAGMHGVHGIGEGVGVYGEGGHTGVYGNGTDDGVKGESTNGNAVHGLGINGNGVLGESTNGIGVAGHSDSEYGVYGEGGEYGGFFTTNQGGTWYDHNAGVNAATAHDHSDGVRAYTIGYGSHGVHASTTGGDSPGVHASTAGDDSHGVRAKTSGNYSDGVFASTAGVQSTGVCVYTIGYGSHGVHASTYGNYSEGVIALTTGNYSDGVYAYTTGNYSEGVHAYSDKGCGVYGIGGEYGGYFTTNQGGTSWYDRNAGVNATTTHHYSDGVHASTTGDGSHGVRAYTTGNYSHGVYASTKDDGSDGVYASTIGDDSEGVYVYTEGNDSEGFYALTIGDDSDGVSAFTTGDGSHGVCGNSVKGTGVYGRGEYGGYFTTNQDGSVYDCNAAVNATTTYDWSDGVYAYTTGHGSDGVDARAYGLSSMGVHAAAYGQGGIGVDAYSDKSDGILARTGRSDHKYGVKTPDKMCAMSYDTGCADVAEYFSTPEDPEPGTVMVIDPAGGSRLRSSVKAYDTTVAGIVSTEPGVSLGTKEDGNDGEKLIAVAGRVPCKVDASYAAIKPGDLLTTSDTPGHAMKATNPVIGTILGKALEPLDTGTGTIEVLVTLQ